MKQNKYDDEIFFEKYSGMQRSVEGLAGAGEWHELQKLLPDFTGMRVLDLGCGFGWHCVWAADHGASEVVGVDISEKMLAEARRKTTSDKVRYVQSAMEDIDFAPGSFDVVISSLALHYVADFGAVCAKIAACLAPGGVFVFSAEHPVFTAEGSQQWVEDENGGKLHWPVDSYFTEGCREASFLGESVVKYHKTLTTYLNTLLQNGFAITAIVEPQPAPDMMGIPGMADELRRPMMLLVRAHKHG